MAEMTAEQKVKSVYPHAKAEKVNLGMDSVSVSIVTLHGSAGGFFMEDVKTKAWADAASRLPEQPAPVADTQELPPLDVTDESRNALLGANRGVRDNYHARRVFLELHCRERQLREALTDIAALRAQLTSRPQEHDTLAALQIAVQRTTPGPWSYQEASDVYTHIIRDPSGNSIVAYTPQNSSADGDRDARFIVAACNYVRSLLPAPPVQTQGESQ